MSSLCGLLMSIAAIPVLLAATSLTEKATAHPADVLASKLSQIQRSLPSGFTMRLPSKILLRDPADDEFIQKLIVQVHLNDSPFGIAIDLLSCNNNPNFAGSALFPLPALILLARLEFRQHLAAATPIQLSREIRGTCWITFQTTLVYHFLRYVAARRNVLHRSLLNPRAAKHAVHGSFNGKQRPHLFVESTSAKP